MKRIASSRRLAAAVAAVWLGGLATARGADFYVATNGSGADGLSWSTAYTNIQTALTGATHNAKIYLAGHNFILTNGLVWTNWPNPPTNVSLLGGYAATNDADQPGPYDAVRWPTVIAPTGNTVRLLYVANVTNPLIARITFQGGYSSWPGGAADYSYGVYAYQSANLRMQECRVVNNCLSGTVAEAYGGGMACNRTSALISNTAFIGNTVGGGPRGWGGGLYLKAGSVQIADSVFIGNVATRSGNLSYYGWGGAVYVTSGVHTLRNILVINNNVGGAESKKGGGICVDAGASTVTVANATFYGNNPEYAIYNLCDNLTVRNSIFYNNQPSAFGGTAPAQSSNLVDTAPGFAEDWFYLAPDSVCRHAGDCTAAAAGLSAYTTQTNGAAYNPGDVVDLGYHYKAGLPALTNLYVDPAGGSDGAAGTNWATALRTITRGLQLAQPGAVRTRLNLKAGDYTNGAEIFPLTIAGKMVQIVGTNRAATVISAAASTQRVFTVTNASDGWTRLEGLTIRGGTLSPGGGMQICNSLVALDDCLVTNNVFVGFAVDGYGAGAYVIGSTLKIVDSEFRANSNSGFYGYGGGLYAARSSGIISNTIFAGNTVCCDASRRAYGGGADLESACLEIQASAFIGNRTSGGSAYVYGGGLCLEGGRFILRNLLLTLNNTVGSLSIYRGAAVAVVATNTDLTLENCTIVTNLQSVGAIYSEGNLTARNTIMWGNQAAGCDFYGAGASAANFFHCCSTQLTHGVQGNITVNPAFTNAAAGNYRLLATSPCINTGTNLPWMAGARDLDGRPRMLRWIVDMGAYEFSFAGMPGTVMSIR